MKIVISQKSILDQLVKKMAEVGNGYTESSGVYNKADPTQFFKANASIWLEYGFSDEGEYPEPEEVNIDINDCTWGTNVIFDLPSLGKISAYLDHEDDDWSRVSDNFEKVFVRLLNEGCSESPEEFQYDMPIYQ